MSDPEPRRRLADLAKRIGGRFSEAPLARRLVPRIAAVVFLLVGGGVAIWVAAPAPVTAPTAAPAPTPPTTVAVVPPPPVTAPAPVPVAPAGPELPLPTGTWAELSERFAEGDCPSYLQDARRRMIRARDHAAPEPELARAAALLLRDCERDRRRIAAAPAEVAGMDVAALEARYLERGPGTPDQKHERIALWRSEVGDDLAGYRLFLLLQVVTSNP